MHGWIAAHLVRRAFGQLAALMHHHYMIRSLAGESLSILLVEHDVDLVMSLSDHVVVMHQGGKLAEGTPQQVRSNPAVQSAYFGDAIHA